MVKRLGELKLPQGLVKDEASASPTFGRFIAEPFESGFGHSLGNTLRRVLLGAIEGAAITCVRIQGVDHEFQSVEGVVEDVTEIILNLKKVIFKHASRQTAWLKLDVEREGAVMAQDISCTGGFEVVNPSHVICHLNSKRRFQMDLELKVGRAYALASAYKKEPEEIGLVPIDALFSPVRLVRYYVEDTRVGQMTNFDRLILEIETDGRISPDEALKEAVVVLQRHLNVFDEVHPSEMEFDDDIQEVNEEQNRLKVLLNMSVNEIELSVRAANCLNNANITTVGELASKSEAEMLKYRNFGKKSLNEIRLKLEELGLSLGSRIDDRLLEKRSL
ncbi:MAG: DNA-directed RNA polymerase subunit alpha [Puniceicoccales bacterium]|jgi:DNA-directed RNA polymerase subunit alpha|nr:DNA-directed RNA polymerase subunit alpha [Puniceicoccales bacterium]